MYTYVYVYIYMYTHYIYIYIYIYSMHIYGRHPVVHTARLALLDLELLHKVLAADVLVSRASVINISSGSLALEASLSIVNLT